MTASTPQDDVPQRGPYTPRALRIFAELAALKGQSADSADTPDESPYGAGETLAPPAAAASGSVSATEHPDSARTTTASPVAGQTVAVASPPNLPRATHSRPRRRGLPLLLFLATCASTFYVGATNWNPGPYLLDSGAALQQMTQNWQGGLVYMTAILAILLTHEMGHFLTTLIYHIPASYPLFIPVPIHPVGTLGAVIGMDGLRANRRQIFDLGLSGPVAGLVVALPVLWIGIARLDLTGPPGELQFHNPLVGKLIMAQLHPAWAQRTIGFEQLNPFFMAGWVGMLITGLNMLPISQLDGGHVIHALFTRRAKFVARGFLIVAIAYVVTNEAYNWTVMLVLVIFIGTDHPPSSDDRMPLGPVRWLLGLASLAIPIFCFAPLGIEI